MPLVIVNPEGAVTPLFAVAIPSTVYLALLRANTVPVSTSVAPNKRSNS